MVERRLTRSLVIVHPQLKQGGSISWIPLTLIRLKISFFCGFHILESSAAMSRTYDVFCRCLLGNI